MSGLQWLTTIDNSHMTVLGKQFPARQMVMTWGWFIIGFTTLVL